MPDPVIRSWQLRSKSRATTSRRLPQLLLLLVSVSIGTTLAQPAPSTRVGLPLTLTDLYIPGGEAKPKPRPNREPPLVVRLIEVKPAQDGKRYDFEVYGLEPGDYDLATFLEAADPANPPRFPAIPLTITTELPPGLPRPAELNPTAPQKLGGYTLALWCLGSLWLLGLIALLCWRRKKQSSDALPESTASLAERLRSLLVTASQGELNDDQKAKLERLILGHWRQRLPNLADLQPAQALSTLRHHDQAGPLLRQLEQWLHARNPQVDPNQLDELLAPYRD